MSDDETQKSGFNQLDPDLTIHLVEEALGIRCSNICRPLNSYINRVYEVMKEDGDSVVAKFYRPGRWSRETIEDEIQFVAELEEAEIPVVAPLENKNGERLSQHEDMSFAIFPRKGGRICDEPTDDQWMELGRLFARMHLVGETATAEHRITVAPEASMTDHIEHILESNRLPPECVREYEEVALETRDLIDPLFDDEACIRIHGDCHHQNLIYRPGESFFLIDFDDMAMGPPIQDLWMLLPGRIQDSRIELELFLEGYEMFRTMPRKTLRLVEALRAMRYIHFASWCVTQVEDGGFNRLAPNWGDSQYWNQEIRELRKQQVEIKDAMELSMPGLL